MSVRGVVPVLIGCLLIVAGCAAPTAPTSPPPGLSNEGVTDTPALVQAHTNALQSSPFVVHSTTTMRGGEQEFRVTTNRTWRIDPTAPIRGSVVRTTMTTGNAPERYAKAPEEVASWRNGTNTYQRIQMGNDTRYQRVDLFNSSVKLNPALHRKTILGLMTHSNATIERVSRDGAQFYLVAAELNDTHITTNASMTLLVAPNGIVHEIRTAQTVQYRSSSRRITEHIRFISIGTTSVDRPDWVQRAVEKT